MPRERPRARAPLGALVFLARAGIAENRLITALLVLAVAAGVGFQIANTANLEGYTAELRAQVVTHGYGEVRIAARRGSRFDVTPELRACLAADPDIATWVPVLALPGAIGVGGTFRNALVIAVDGDASRKPYRVATGAAPTRGDRDGVLAGITLAQRLGLAAGTTAELRVVTAAAPIDGGALGDDGVLKLTVTVRGTATGTFAAPEAVFVDRAVLAGELPETEPATTVAIYLRDGATAREVARRLAAAVPELVVLTWREDSSFASSAIASSSALGSLSRWMVAFAVIVPVWALLYIHVLHRRRAIALITALGLGRGEVFAIYVLQALLIGIVGLALGAAAGYAAIRWFEIHPIFQMSTFEVRPVVSAGTFAWPMGLVLGITLAASIVPALGAARTDPTKILRGRA